NIAIAPSATNEVNHPHTFVVTVTQNLGDGKGFVAAANEPVRSEERRVSEATTARTSFSVTTDSAGHASVTFTSATAGQGIGDASTTFAVGGVPLTRATGNSHAGDGGPPTKTFADAKIAIAPSATNGITEPHTFTVTVMQNLGDGKGFVAAANEPV